MLGQGVIRAGKVITFVISNEDMNNVITIVKSLENWGILIDGVMEIVKHEIKTQENVFLGMLLKTLGASMLGNLLTGKGKGVMRAGRAYSNMNYMNKNF